MKKLLFSESYNNNRSKNNALLASGFIFVLIALVQLLRLFLQVEVVIAGYTVPRGASLAASLVMFALAVWMFSARGK